MSEKQDEKSKTKVDKKDEDKPKIKDDKKHEEKPKTKDDKKHEEKSKKKDDENADADIPKPQSTVTAKKDEKKDDNKEGNEHTVEQIDKELDELRPPPPSPKTKHRIEEQERVKDHQIEEQHNHKGHSASTEAKSGHEGETHHKDNELTPGEPDPSVDENTRIPILTDRGDVELKPQLGSALHRNTNNNSSNNIQPTSEDKKDNSSNNAQPTPEDKKDDTQPDSEDKKSKE